MLINSRASLSAIAHHISSTCTCTVGYTTSNALFSVNHSSISLRVFQAARLGLRVHNPLLPFVKYRRHGSVDTQLYPNWLDIYHDYAEKPPSLQLAFENIKTMVSMLNAVVEVGCSPLATLVLGLPGNFKDDGDWLGWDGKVLGVVSGDWGVVRWPDGDWWGDLGVGIEL